MAVAAGEALEREREGHGGDRLPVVVHRVRRPRHLPVATAPHLLRGLQGITVSIHYRLFDYHVLISLAHAKS